MHRLKFYWLDKLLKRKFVNILISHPSVLTYVLGAKNNHLILAVLLSTYIICFGWLINMNIFF